MEWFGTGEVVAILIATVALTVFVIAWRLWGQP
jgi:hypothetical protein